MNGTTVFIFDSKPDAIRAFEGFMKSLSKGIGGDWAGDLLTNLHGNNPSSKPSITVQNSLKKRFNQYLRDNNIEIKHK